jgi:Mg-chelatase subunit ChlD
VLPLTYNWTALANKVNSMQPNGTTNVTIGLVWAWHMLTQSAPYTIASAPAADLDKIIILLTDGENTEAWNNATNTKVTYTPTLDARTKLACDNVKAANIKLYTVRVIEGNASLLRACASNSSTMYFEVSQASQLNNVFNQIYENLASLRLSK